MLLLLIPASPARGSEAMVKAKLSAGEPVRSMRRGGSLSAAHLSYWSSTHWTESVTQRVCETTEVVMVRERQAKAASPDWNR